MKSQRHSILLFCIAALFLMQCGYDDIPEAILKTTKNIQFASLHDLSEKRVVKGSYLIGQFTESTPELELSSVFKLRDTQFFNNQDLFSSVRGNKTLTLIASLPISQTNVDASTSSDDWLQLLNFAPRQLTGSRTSQFLNIFAVDFFSDSEARVAIAEWYQSGKIAYAEPNRISHLNQTDDSNVWNQYITKYDEGGNPNTTNHDLINLTGAFSSLSKISGSEDVRPVIAIMDSGVDIEHQALSEQLWENPSQGKLSCGNNDFNGCNTTAAVKATLGDGRIQPFGRSGYDEACEEGEDIKACEHGTHVSGIAAASPDYESPGVCPTCRIMVLRIYGKIAGTSESGISDTAIAAGLRYISFFAKSDPVRIVNSSFGKYDRSRTVSVLVKALKDKSGTVLIGASGNEDATRMQYPAALPDAIAVSNVNKVGEKATSSNFGSWVDIAAPGSGIYSSLPGGYNGQKQGTSMASPVVAGVAGLIVSANPGISADDLRNSLINTTNPNLYDNDINRYYFPRIAEENASIPLLGSGTLDAEAAVNGIDNPNQPAFIPLDRVKPGCGEVGMPHSNSSFFESIFLWPLIFILCGLKFPPRLLQKEQNDSISS